MSVDKQGGPVSDLSRAIQHEPDTEWPTWVKVQLVWQIDGHNHVRTMHIEGDHFFGRGGFGAPMEGAALIGQLENLRKQGPPPVERKPSGSKKKR